MRPDRASLRADCRHPRRGVGRRESVASVLQHRVARVWRTRARVEHWLPDSGSPDGRADVGCEWMEKEGVGDGSGR